MQDIHLVGDGRVFTATDRRLRQAHLQNQALKCPRCDSHNTKFCYYNNYNLSQPRHFCKSCRRYWTKDGVLRNVPVGGGCRKSSKRSSSSKLSKAPDGCGNGKPNKTNNSSNSSSESSSLTGAAIAAAAAADLAAAPSASAATPPSAEGVSSSFEAVFGFGQYIFPQIKNPNFTSEVVNIPQGNNGGCINFATMMTSTSNNQPTDLNTSYDVVSSHGINQPHRQLEQWQLGSEEAKSDGMAGAAGGYINPTVQMDQSSNLGCQPLSWQEQQQQQMFGLNSAVDQVYWSQHEWSNSDNPNQHLYLP